MPSPKADPPTAPSGIDLRSQSEAALELIIDTSLYTDAVIFKASYWFTDRCYLLLERQDSNHVLVRLTPRDLSIPLSAIAGEFCNELINRRVQQLVSDETRMIRELIVAQAFAESGLTDVPVQPDSVDTGTSQGS